MFEPDTTAYYILLFGGAIAGPLFFFGAIAAIFCGIKKKSPVFLFSGMALILLFGVLINIHPLSSMLIWQRGTDLRMSEMQLAVKEEGLMVKKSRSYLIDLAIHQASIVCEATGAARHCDIDAVPGLHMRGVIWLFIQTEQT